MKGPMRPRRALIAKIKVDHRTKSKYAEPTIQRTPETFDINELHVFGEFLTVDPVTHWIRGVAVGTVAWKVGRKPLRARGRVRTRGIVEVGVGAEVKGGHAEVRADEHTGDHEDHDD